MKKIKILIFILMNMTMVIAQNNPKTDTWMYKINDSVYETDKILIGDNPQETYRLEMKNGKPWDGYEVSNEVHLSELRVVNFYENGVLKAKYNVDVLDLEEMSGSVLYNLKTTYKNGKPWDGYVFNELILENFSMLLGNSYKSGMLNKFQINTFAMHSFNRINFELVNDTILISKFESDESLKIYKQGNIVMADYLKNAKVLETSTSDLEIVKEASPSSYSVFYADNDGKLKQINLKHLIRKAIKTEEDFLQAIYMSCSFEYKGSISDVFNEMSKITQIKDVQDFSFTAMLDPLIVPYNRKNVKSYLSYNSVGLIHQGQKLTLNEDGTYTLQTYEQGEPTEKQIIKDLKAYQPNLD